MYGKIGAGVVCWGKEQIRRTAPDPARQGGRARKGGTYMQEFLYRNGTILTMDEARGLYAEALLVRDGRIAAVGPEAAVAAEARSPEVIDLHGATLMPSFLDPHSHLSSYAMNLQQIPMEGAASYAEIVARVQRYLAENDIPADRWVTAYGYDHNALAEHRPPDRTVLDAAAPRNPLVLQHVSGHTGVFNTRALQALGLDAATPDPAGGRFARAADGSLTGYAEENAFIETIKRIPQPDGRQLLGCYRKAQQCYAAYGITTVQDGLVIDQMAPLYGGLCAADTLFLDTVAYVDFRACDALLTTFADNLGQYRHHFKIGGYKTFLDGSPQARTAWMRTPYLPAPGADEPAGYRGYPALQDEELFAQLCRALREGRQVLAHCNGDAAAQQYLDQYARARAAVPGAPDIRPVMIHAQFLDRDQLPALADLGMTPSFFVAHVYHWGDVHIRNVGLERAARISPTASALAAGLRFTFHQDAPVIQPDMLETIWCAVNRVTRAGVPLGEGERISTLEALKAVTVNAAWQYFEEDRKGTLAPGKLADLVALSADPLKTPAPALRDIRVLETWKEGRSVFRA